MIPPNFFIFLVRIILIFNINTVEIENNWMIRQKEANFRGFFEFIVEEISGEFHFLSKARENWVEKYKNTASLIFRLSDNRVNSKNNNKNDCNNADNSSHYKC